MDFKVKKLSEVTAEVTLKSSPEEVEAAYLRAYKKAQAKIKLPGFRQGKVPLDLVERHLGESVAEDAARELIAHAFEDVVEDLDPVPISIPRFEIDSFERGKGATFRGAYDTMPRVKLGKYRKIKVTEDQAVIKDTHIQAELERMRTEKSTLRTREQDEGSGAQNGDFVTADIKVEDVATGQGLFQNDNFRFQLGAGQSLPGLDDQIVGTAVGASKSFELPIEESFPDANFAGKILNVHVQIKNCEFAELPELNDDFARDMGEYESLADLKKEIRKGLEEQARTALKQRSMNEILRQVAEGSKIHIPDSVLESEFKQRFEQIKQRLGNRDLDLDGLAKLSGQSRDKLESELRESATRTTQERLVLREITEVEKIEVSAADVDQEIQTTYSRFLPGAQLKEIMQNEQIRDDVQGRLLYVKGLEWLYENADVRKGQDTDLETLKEQGVLS